MANDIKYYIQFKSNGKEIMQGIVHEVQKVNESMESVKNVVDSTADSFGNFLNYCASAGFALQGAVDGLEGLAAPVMSFDKAMRAANTMAGKGAEEFAELQNSVKGLAGEIRDKERWRVTR